MQPPGTEEEDDRRKRERDYPAPVKPWVSIQDRGHIEDPPYALPLDPDPYADPHE